MTIDLAKVAKDKGIAYFLISFTDLFGVMRAKLVPSVAINKMAAEGAAFAGFATWLDMNPAHPDLFAVPDPASLTQLPWKPEVGWLAADLWMDGKEAAQGPRNTLAPGRRRGRGRGLPAEDRRGMRIPSHHARRRRASPIPATPSPSPATTSRP